MHHFFVTPKQVKENDILIEGADVNHIKNVLRMKIGEPFKVSDGDGNIYLCKVGEIQADTVKAFIESREQAGTELASKIYLFQGLPKSDKMEWIIQKAVELGVYEVIPVVTKRTIVKLDEKKAQKKRERWNMVAESAAKQSGRGLIPTVSKMMQYEEALHYGGDLDVLLIPYELAEGMAWTKEVLNAIGSGHSVGVFIGPEGGFEKTEVDQAVKAGAKEITLGKRILRTETAGLAVLSILMYHLES